MIGSMCCSVPSWSTTKEFMNSKYQTNKTKTDSQKHKPQKRHITSYSIQPAWFGSTKSSLTNINSRPFATA